MKLTEKKGGLLSGILLIGLFASAAFLIGDFEWVKALSFSPLIVGILMGILYANTLRSQLPDSWGTGIVFCSKQILRLGIILYGFRLSFQDVLAVGLPAIIIDALMVVLTIGIGILVGKWLKMDKETTLLTACGSAICGAAAVMGADGAIRPKPFKTAVAVTTVVIFGTISMFLYPILYRAGIFDLDASQMGVYIGSSVHEVAHVVGAGNAISADVSDNAIIVKMIRVMMLVPVLLVLAFIASRGQRVDGTRKTKITVPWFAIMFLVVIGFNSLNILPAAVVSWINTFDTFLLTMAMTALGAETTFDKFKKAGFQPFVLAAVLWIWLMVGGYMLAKYMVPLWS